MVAADQAWRSEAKSQPEDPPTEWLVAETQRMRMDVIIMTKIAFTAHSGLSPSIFFPEFPFYSISKPTINQLPILNQNIRNATQIHSYIQLP